MWGQRAIIFCSGLRGVYGRTVFVASRSTYSRLLLRQWQLPLHNVRNQEKPNVKTGRNFFANPGREVHLRYKFTNSAARNCRITDFGNRQNGEKTAVIRGRSDANIFLCLNVNNSCMNMHEICPNYYMKLFSHWARYYKTVAVGLDFIWGPWHR